MMLWGGSGYDATGRISMVIPGYAGKLLCVGWAPWVPLIRACEPKAHVILRNHAPLRSKLQRSRAGHGPEG
eukprot:69125-Rhodomonas_salina.1